MIEILMPDLSVRPSGGLVLGQLAGSAAILQGAAAHDADKVLRLVYRPNGGGVVEILVELEGLAHLAQQALRNRGGSARVFNGNIRARVDGRPGGAR